MHIRNLHMKLRRIFAATALSLALVGPASMDGCGGVEEAFLTGYEIGQGLSSYDDSYGYDTGYGGGWNDSYGGGFYSNWYTDTAVSSSGDSGYIALGDGEFYSW